MASIFANRAWSAEEKAKLTMLLEEGDKVLCDVQTLKDGLKDTVTSISEEYDIPKRALNKAIRAYHKKNLEDDKESMSEVEEILTLTGKTV
jgi:transposase-like protein